MSIPLIGDPKLVGGWDPQPQPNSKPTPSSTNGGSVNNGGVGSGAARSTNRAASSGVLRPVGVSAARMVQNRGPVGLMDLVEFRNFGDRHGGLLSATLNANALVDAHHAIQSVEAIMPKLEALILPSSHTLERREITLAGDDWLRFIDALDAKKINVIQWGNEVVYTLEQLRRYDSANL